MESTEENSPCNSEEKSNPSLSAAQRRAEIRRRKLLKNSEDRINRIVGYSKTDGENSQSPKRVVEPRFHLDLDRSESWSSPVVATKILSPFLSDPSHTPERRGSPLPDTSDNLNSSGFLEDDLVGVVRQRPRGELAADEHSRPPAKGLQKYLSRFDDAMKLRGQLANEKAAQESSSETEELDSFRLFRLVGSVILAVFVRVFACKYLSIFAPFLTLELAYMGLHKYFPKVETKPKTTVLTAALLLSGIPAEVINRSMDTYRKMGDVFADLCVYFFTFILSHELLVLFGSELPEGS
ncbi:calcium signal-modulating cyclophilin ligand [Clupea harengus]|uniref:Guided entry of tail-anchored proteins factor n=1 Tax=Clupea harengus TaxID=7950 RepID=A0A6P3VMH0_CLUHA|nr:calcium signal-modulating cyclophilin ligand [Clupea harengus]